MKNSKHLNCFGFIFSFWAIMTLPAFGQVLNSPKGEAMLLKLNIERKLEYDIEGNLYQDHLYLPVTELFPILKIKSHYLPDKLILRVHFPSKQEVQLDLKKNIVTYQDKLVHLSGSDIFYTKNEVFICKKIIEKIFNFDILFSYRKLEVILFSKHKLPIIEFTERKNRYKEFSNFSHFSDSAELLNIPTKHYLLKDWTADWSLSSSHSVNYYNYTYGLGIGGQLLGGNFSSSVFGSKQYGLNTDRIKWRWKYPIYSSSILKEIQIGDLRTKNSLLDPGLSFKGIKLSNHPNGSRFQFDDITLEGRLNKDWDSEFYVNHQFQDYAIGNNKNKFKFTSPLKYGSNLIELKYYNNLGFSHQQKYLIYIPQEFLPPGKFEYSLSAGQYNYLKNQAFGKLDLKWGVSSNITMSSGMLWERFETQNLYLPFIQTGFRLGNNAIANAGYLFQQMTAGSLRLYFPGSQSIQFDVKKFYGASIFNKMGMSLDARLSASLPIKLQYLNFSSFLSSRYTSYESGIQSLSLYAGISSILPFGFNLYFENQIRIRKTSWQNSPNISNFSSQIDLSKNISRKLMIRPSLEYSQNLHSITNSKLNLRYRFSSNSYFSFSFNRDHLLKTNQFLLNFRLDFPFARHSSTVYSNSNHTSFNQTTSGSVIFNKHFNHFNLDKQSQTNRSLLAIKAFLDINQNGLKDPKEPSVKGVTANIYNNKKENDPFYKDTKLAKNLIPYNRYYLKINTSGLSNPLWQPTHKSFSKVVLPNSYNIISVPLIITGEVSGSIKLDGERNPNLTNGLNIHLISIENGFDITTKSYSDGNFYYVGLKPGKYVASLDSLQLTSRSLEVKKDSITFTVKATRQGDIVDGIRFDVKPTNTSKDSLTEVYTIQVGAFKKKQNAIKCAVLTKIKTDYNIKIIYDPNLDLYKCHMGTFKTWGKALRVRDWLRDKSYLYEDVFIVKIHLL